MSESNFHSQPYVRVIFLPNTEGGCAPTTNRYATRYVNILLSCVGFCNLHSDLPMNFRFVKLSHH